MTSYAEFLAQKEPRIPDRGFDAGALNPALFPWQEQLVRWALRRGRSAFFWDCGLGKTLAQLEWAHQVATHTGRKVLVLTPLAVAAQTIQEGKRFGIQARYAKDIDDVGTGITVTNYERLDHFDPHVFAGVVLDESSILKAFSGKTKRALVDAFAETPFRLACTATPSPNDVLELGNHCEFLGVMSSHEMLARWFINDTMTAGNYRLKRHAEADYWRWVASWATCLSSPADLLDPAGKPYDARKFKLPALRLVEHVVEGPPALANEGELLSVANVNATSLYRELRRSMAERAEVAARLVNAEPGEPWVLWVNTDAEADALQELLPDALEVRGSHRAELKEERLAAFGEGRALVLISKASICGWGLNWPHCARTAFVGVSYSYEAFYQALRRFYRFGQKRPVEAHVICARGELGVRDVLARKQEQHAELQRRMAEAQRATQQPRTPQDLRARIGGGDRALAVPGWLQGGSSR